jgi:hypothetical protein
MMKHAFLKYMLFGIQDTITTGMEGQAGVPAIHGQELPSSTTT